MDYKRLSLAAVVTWIVDSIYGMVVWMGMLGNEMAQNPAVFRPEDAMNAHLPLMFAGGLLAMFALVYIYSKGYEGGGLQEGVRFGVVLGIFLVAFVSVPIYASFNVGGRLAVLASVASFLEMVIVGGVIGLMYKPAVRTVGARV